MNHDNVWVEFKHLVAKPRVDTEIIFVHQTIDEKQFVYNAILYHYLMIDCLLLLRGTLNTINDASEGVYQSISHVMDVFGIISLQVSDGSV